jgi:SRSO17 transposase
VRRGGEAGLQAGDVLAPASYEGVDGPQMVEVEVEGEVQGEGVDGEIEALNPRSSPGQIHPSRGWPPPQHMRAGACAGS